MRPLDDLPPPRKRSTFFVLAIVTGTLLGSCLLCCGGGLLLGFWGIEQDRKKLEEANRQWDAGQKADAVTMYKALIERDAFHYSDEAQRPIVYKRVIEYELEKGNIESAKAFVEKALDKNIELPADSKAMTELVAQVRTDRERREAEERARREADEKRKQEEREAEAKRKEVENKAQPEQRGTKERLAGEWTCISEIISDEPADPRYHKKWTFNGDRLRINSERELSYRVDEKTSPKRLYILLQNGRVMYACVYKFEGDKLIVCCEAGEEPPGAFTAGKDDSSFLLTFTK